MASSEVQQLIKEAISQDKVVVFSKTYCPYCTLAKDVFSKVKQPIKVIELDQREDGGAIQENLVSISGFRTIWHRCWSADEDVGIEGTKTLVFCRRLVSGILLGIARVEPQTDVPQVFINGNCVGGGSDVKALYESGKLEPMLIG